MNKHCVAIVDGGTLIGENGTLDITGIDDVEIRIRSDGKVIWVNGPDCKVRICSIRGVVNVVDERNN